jgi:hypothetical protein
MGMLATENKRLWRGLTNHAERAPPVARTIDAIGCDPWLVAAAVLRVRSAHAARRQRQSGCGSSALKWKPLQRDCRTRPEEELRPLAAKIARKRSAPASTSETVCALWFANGVIEY